MTFEDMLADPLEQFDPRSELLASIAAYAAAPPACASSSPPRVPQNVVWLHVPGDTPSAAADAETPLF